ncbi:MAG TPA: hypothetical protein DEP69_06990, partial [Acidimicrobiaceae bacterium]|nr:hypothetical protein [Acidimicrobiaceae bacterium]
MDDRTHDERHAAACAVFDGFTAGAGDAERAARAMTRRLGALGTFAFDVVLGDVWARPQLGRRDRSLVVVSVLAAIGSTEELSFHVEAGLNNGLTRTEIEEVLLTVAVYAGYPMAISASRVVDAKFCALDGVERLPEREPGAHTGDAERRVAAADVRRTLTAGRAAADPDVDLAALVERLGEVGRIAYHWAFGDVWSRTQLSRRDRSVAVIAILTVLGLADELAFHVPVGLNHGLSRTEVEEVMVQMTIYGGVPRAVEGVRAMRAAFDRIDARA